MSNSNITRNKKLLFLVTEDWYFCSHRLSLACAAKNAGYDVVVATHVQIHGEIITQKGLRILEIKMRRRSSGLVGELYALLDVIRIYKREQPDIVHHVALKPVLVGSVAAIFYKKIKVVNAIAGLGFVFSSKRLSARLLKPVIMLSLRWLLNQKVSRVIVQNPDDFGLLIESMNIQRDKIALIRGAGVDISSFTYIPEPDGDVVVVLVARMLWDKGIAEYVEAVRRLKQRGLSFRAVLVGSPDDDNPASITTTQLEKWNEEGFVEWKGHVDNIASVWSNSHISILPSYYGEGVPKSLIEAAACGRPIVTTDMPGCREIVKHQVNGFLVPPRDVDSLASAISNLILDKTLRERMGRAGRERVEAEFSEDIVINKTLALYESLLQ